MSEKLNLLAISFSTGDYVELMKFKENNQQSLEIDLKEQVCTGPFVSEFTRPGIKRFVGDGILICDHSNRSRQEIYSALQILNDFDKDLYSLKNGFEKLTFESLQN